MALVQGPILIDSMTRSKFSGAGPNVSSMTRWLIPGRRNNRIMQWGTTTWASGKSAVPDGYLHPSALLMPRSSGSISSHNLKPVADFDGAPVSGMPAEGEISATATLTGTGGLIVAAIGAINASATFDGTMAGVLLASGAINATATLAADIGAIAGLTGAITATSLLSLTSYAVGYLAGDIDSAGETLTASSVAAAVWSALAASYDEAGTMGEKMNASGSAGDPWTTTVPGAYADGTAGALMGKLLTTARFLGLK